MKFNKHNKILIVVATELELGEIKNYYNNNLQIDFLISGIGIHATTYSLTKTLLQKKYDLVLNIGICGSFSSELQLGTCVNVISDEFADIGVTDANNNFSTLFNEGFVDYNIKPFKNAKLHSGKNILQPNLKEVSGITVNNVSGNLEQINNRKLQFKADVETMEGAAVAYVCLLEGIEFVQIRSVSNYVKVRNKQEWDIALAISNLQQAVIVFIDGCTNN